MKKIKNISKKTILIALGVVVGAGVSVLAATWQGTDWIEEGELILSVKMANNFDNLNERIKKVDNKSYFGASSCNSYNINRFKLMNYGNLYKCIKTTGAYITGQRKVTYGQYTKSNFPGCKAGYHASWKYWGWYKNTYFGSKHYYHKSKCTPYGPYVWSRQIK